MRQARVVVSMVALVAVAVAGPHGGPLLAQEPGSLAGETLTAGAAFPGTRYTTAAGCDLEGVSTISFTAEGLATGPYPGAFTESGTTTVGPQAAVGFPSGPVLSFESTFTIRSGTTTVTGSKRLLTPGTASCITPEEHGGAAPQYRVEVRTSIVEYSATVTGPLGTWLETGTASVSSIDSRLTEAGPQTVAGFGETFLTATRDAEPATVVLGPGAAVNEVGTAHTVTATVTTASGQPVEGAVVAFAVTGAVRAEGSCRTDTSGQCAFSYQGPAFPGADVITAYVDIDSDGGQDGDEPTGQATTAWVLPVSTPGHVTGGGRISHLGRAVQFGLEAIRTGDDTKGHCTVTDEVAGTHIRCVTVTVLVQSPTHAVLFGTATQNAQLVRYRIDVDDLNESGAGADSFQIRTDAGYLAAGVLTEGNIQIHTR